VSIGGNLIFPSGFYLVRVKAAESFVSLGLEGVVAKDGEQAGKGSPEVKQAVEL
jgi:hypothetical protein